MLLSGLILCACGTKKSSDDNSENQTENKDKKVLVAYFSATGTTKKVAEKIAQLSGGTLFEIEPAVPYTDADLDWRDSLSRSTIEMKEKETSRPEIKDKIEDFAQYDIVYVGFPVWWYTCPTIINTFLESYDFAGKTIVPFATSGGSPIEPCVKDMEKSAPDAKFVDAKLWNKYSDTDIENWIKSVK